MQRRTYIPLAKVPITPKNMSQTQNQDSQDLSPPLLLRHVYQSHLLRKIHRPHRCVHECMYACIYIHTYICVTYTKATYLGRLTTFTCVCACMYVCMYAYTYIHLPHVYQSHLPRKTHRLHRCVHVCIHMYMYMYTYICLTYTKANYHT